MVERIDRKGRKLPLVLSIAALLIAALGFTPLGEAGRNLVFPKNSIGTNQIKPGAVKRADIATNAVNSAKIADGAVSSLDIADGAIASADVASGVIPAAFSGAAAAGDLAGTYPNPTIKDGAITPAKHAVVPTARLTHNAAQSTPGDATVTLIQFNTEVFDSANLHDPAANNTRISITTPGVYMIGATLTWDPNATGAREINIRKNGTTNLARVVQDGNGGGNTTDQAISTLARLVAGDFVEITIRQNSTVALNVTSVGEYSPIFWATWVGPAPA